MPSSQRSPSPWPSVSASSSPSSHRSPRSSASRTTAAAAVVSIFALTRFAASPLAGWLVDRTGERLILGTGIFIVGISSALAGLSQTYWQLLVLRGAGGIGSAMFTVAAYALLLRVVLPEQRGRAALAFQGGFLIGGVTGPLFGVPLVAISIRLPFFVYAATLLIAGSIGLVFLAQSKLQDREEEAGTDIAPTPLSVAIRQRAYWAAVTNNLATGWSLFGIRGSVLPLFVTEAMLLSESWVSIGIFISALAQGCAAHSGRPILGHARTASVDDHRVDRRRPGLRPARRLRLDPALHRGHGPVRVRLGPDRHEQHRSRRRRRARTRRSGDRGLPDVV